MSNKPTGIIDPWQVVDPVLPTKRPRPDRPDRIDLEDIDFDADLAIPGDYVIRSMHASFRVFSTRVEAPSDALYILIECILELTKHKVLRQAFQGAGIGVRWNKVEWNAPSPNEPTSKLETENLVLWFASKPLDEGMLVLARILRMPECASACRARGITVML